MSGKEAKDYALRLLTRRDHSSDELRQKLRQKGFEAETVEDAIQYVTELGYLDDLRCLEGLIRHRADQGYGPQRLKQECLQKGLDQYAVDTLAKDQEIDWGERALQALRKKLGLGRAIKGDDPDLPQADLDWATRQKLSRFLMGRGFSAEHISFAFTKLCKE